VLYSGQSPPMCQGSSRLPGAAAAREAAERWAGAREGPQRATQFPFRDRCQGDMMRGARGGQCPGGRIDPAMTHDDGNSAGGAERRWSRLDKQYVWHPFTPMGRWLAGQDDEPGRMIVAGEGFELIDARGRRYIDGFSSLWCNLHGHRVSAIDEAISHQLGRIAHSTLLGHASPPSAELAERLVRITPLPLTKVFYSDSGATAVEIALKMAYQYFRNTGQVERRRFLALRESYHGDTIGAMSVGGIDLFHGTFRPLLFDATFVDTPNGFHNPAGAEGGHVVLRQIEAELESAPGRYCAVIAEPLIQAAGGMLTHPPGFLSGLRALTRAHDCLLIADEVATGLGRTGRLLACDHEEVTPDLMCLGKGLTGGYLPVAATLATGEIFDAFRAEHSLEETFFHGHTFTGNALGCAAAVASVDLIFESDLLAALPQKAQRIAERLAELRDHPHVADIRQCGMMAGIELVEKRGHSTFSSSGGSAAPSARTSPGGAAAMDRCLHRADCTPFDPALRIGAAVCKWARRHGLIIRPLGDVIVLMPAPAMDSETLERMLTATIKTIHEYFAQSGV